MKFLVSMIDVHKLIPILLNEPWHWNCEIILDYMSPYLGTAKSRTVVRHNDYFLRYVEGPLQGFFWDHYGDDMKSPEVAVVALSKAPFPREVKR